MIKQLRDLIIAALGCAGIMVLVAGFVPVATTAAADDDNTVIEDTYVSPLDLNGSDESVKEQSNSGFDTPGPVTVQPEYYNSTQSDSSNTDSSGSDSESSSDSETTTDSGGEGE